jgi:hypothetical protein
LAKESNTNEYDLDTGLYDYAKSNCGACHPGGGAMEYDRQGNRYDEYLADNNTPANLNGDYYYYNSASGSVELAPWETSGVLEIDCLLCHMEGYSTNLRATEVKAGRFYASPGAGAGFYSTINTDQTVDYNTSLTIALNVDVHDHNCSQCHAMDGNGYTTNSGNARSDIKKRGFTWGPIAGPTGYERDVHDANGISCTDCHTGGLDHQFAKGNEKVGSVRNDLDFTITSCDECHTDSVDDDDLVGIDADSAHTAAGFGGIYNFHMNKIDCTTCHIPHKDSVALRTIEIGGGGYPSGVFKFGMWVNGSPKTPSGWTLEGLKPTYGWWEADDGQTKLFPMNILTNILWGSEDAGGHLSSSVFSRDQMAAAAAAGVDNATWDDSGDGKAEVNTVQEISDMRDALIARGTATSNPNLADPTLWVMPHLFSISHNIRPSGSALGSGGCADCHNSGTWMFDGNFQLIHYEMGDSPYLASHLEIYHSDMTTETLTLDFSAAGHNYMENWKLMGYTQAERDQLVIPR